MQVIGVFKKVSLDQFVTAAESAGFDANQSEATYEKIRKPKRSTWGSAGYDFFSPFSFQLNPGESILIPTGVRVLMDNGWVLMCVPRSGLGFKYRCQLDNTVGIIDSDYSSSDNEGHIMAKLTNDSKSGKQMFIEAGDRIFQGIFLPFGVTCDDETVGTRNGGFGSTGK